MRSLSLCPLRLCGSLKKDVWEVGGSAIAVWEVGRVRSLFGELRGCDRYLGGWGGAIAKRCCKQFAVWEVGGVR
ncbi:hypothetical protein AA650_09085 [Anabaena sp. WA102]|nr:hypothetical protein AA650_09085 [Anabaena sp. WA102]